MEKRNNRIRMAVAVLLSIGILLICMGIGSVEIPAGDALTIVFRKLNGHPMPEDLDPSMISVLWSIRMPRALTAFFVGGALAVSGAVMQAVLQNPLASSYTLGVSSGASLGVALVIVSEISIPVLSAFLLPTAGFAFGLVTVLLVVFLSARIDHNVQSHTIILLGMVVSLFVNALLTLVSSFAGEHSQQLLLWQMGSFSGRRWYHVLVLMPVCILGTIILMRFHRELDIMTFGDEQSLAVGVDTAKVKKILLVLAAFLTGVSVCFSGTIGFVDLIIPHVVRRIFGASHRYVLPMSMLLGGAFMALCDMLSRTLLSPREIPVGAVTALIGAPFFIIIYFRTPKRGNAG